MDNYKPAAVLDSWSSISDKTVFILDRSAYFTQVSSDHSIVGDCIKNCPKKSSHLYSGEPPIAPFDRSLWTCTVEAVVGYSRLVWDLFTPDQRCISILSVGPNNNIVDKAADPTFIQKICTWQDTDQNLDYMMKSLAKMSHTHQICPPQKLLTTKDISSFPNCDAESVCINNSLEQALCELGHLTSAQVERTASSKPSSSALGSNNGRIILISSFQNQESVNKLIDKFEKMLKRKNESLKEAMRQAPENSTSVNLSPINYCDLVIVNTFPIYDEGACSKIGNSSSFRPYIHCKVYSVQSGRIIAGLLNNLCLQHHNLRSTTITGIPMKEEQSASSSSQYDVEIVHCSSIHEDIMNSGSPLLDDVLEVIDRNGFPCDTFKLSWCTPRTTTVEPLIHCVATSRITAVDVNSRPSACLTNFLLNGRTVMLEIFKSKSNRMTTHLLASHYGELYIHSLATTKHKLNISDPPAISDNLGGKVSDYRMNEFVSFMKQHILSRHHMTDEPLTKTLNMIKRQTLYWPTTQGHTILLNVPNLIGKLLQLIPKESLTQADVDDCKSTIDDLFKFQSEGQGIPSVTIPDIVKNPNVKGNGTRLEQLYKLLWNELEYFLRIHSTTSEHEAVLDYLLEQNSDRKPETERGIKRLASKSANSASPLKKAKLSSQLIPEISDTSASAQQTAMYYKTGMSLWQTWTQIHKHCNRNKNKLPFVGRNPQPPADQQTF